MWVQPMTPIIWVAAASIVGLTALAITTKKEWLRRSVATILFTAFVIMCTIVFEADVRLVLGNAQLNGEFSKGFVLGVRRLNEWLLVDRAFYLLIATALFLIALVRRISK
jgi:hypothetical protein